MSLGIAKKILIVIACTAAWLGRADKASAIPLAFGDAQSLGFVDSGIPSGDADRTSYVNYLIGMTPGTSASALGQYFTRSMNTFGPLPTPVFAMNGGGTTINLGTGGYAYLFAKYDGPNWGSEVWYVGNLSGTITIPGSADGGKYGLSGWTLFTGGPMQQVPDGGTTLMLLGASLGSLAIARRTSRRSQKRGDLLT